MCPACPRVPRDLPLVPTTTTPNHRSTGLHAATTKHMSEAGPSPHAARRRLLLYEPQRSLCPAAQGLPVLQEDTVFLGQCEDGLPWYPPSTPLMEATHARHPTPPRPAPPRAEEEGRWGDEGGSTHTQAQNAPLTVAPSGRHLLMTLALCLLLAGGASGSEFPDRECCDSVPPPHPNYNQPTSTTTTIPPPSPRAGNNTSSVSAMPGSSGGMMRMNCIEARQQCNNDPVCWNVLKMLHKICGPELVACATVTPSKCKQLLRTLDTFEYLRQCSCAEPHIDFTCYTFRETVFNHPCLRVDTEEPQYTTMPNCQDALKMCKTKSGCMKNYFAFVGACSYSGYTCTSKEGDKCNEVWRKIRQSEVFGCVCPPEGPMRALAQRQDLSQRFDTLSSYQVYANSDSCVDIYNTTHENPCIGGDQDSSKVVDLVEKTQATCHVALEECQRDGQCRSHLDRLMSWCEHSHCEPDRCREALQKFYQEVSIVRRLQVAFCVCRQNDPDGECLTAMRKLHPTCAERNTGRGNIKCHKVAENCRTKPECRSKLEQYEQKCAADAMTGRCSDTHRSCQQAVMNILGTELHGTCVCKGTDFLHQHDCYTWQKLLWSNPCVIESHLKLHEEISAGNTEELDREFRPPVVPTTPAPQLVFGGPTPEDLGRRGSEDTYGTVIYAGRPDSNPRPNHGSYGIPIDGYPDHDVLIDTGRTRILTDVGREGIDLARIPYGRGGEDDRRGWGKGMPSGGRGGVSRERNGGGLNIGRNGGGAFGRGRNGGLNIGGESTNGGVNIGRNGGTFGRGRNGGGAFGRGRNGGISIGGESSSGGINIGRNGGTFGRNGDVTFEGGRNGGLNNGGRRISDGWNGVGRNAGGRIGGGRGRFGAGEDGRLPYEHGHRSTIIPMESNKENGYWGRDGGLGNVGPTFVRPIPPIVNPEDRTPAPHTPPPPTGYLPTTTTPATTTVPQSYCSIKDEEAGRLKNLRIPEGTTMRIYKDKECSDLCSCGRTDRNTEPEATCIALKCITPIACNTTVATYPHRIPYYRSYRGNCVCYAGKFICQKPEPEMYSLGPGIYLFLGYSKGEMEILKPQTESDELDALEHLKEVLAREYSFKCNLTMKHHINDNFIVTAKLSVSENNYVSPFVKERREREECAGPLQELAEKINVRHMDILSDAYLSMFIVAKVDVSIPEARTQSSSGHALRASPLSLPLELVMAVAVTHLLSTLLLSGHAHAT